MKLFINIASYRDVLLEHTVVSAYENAKYKNDIIFGIVDQAYLLETIHVDGLSFANNIRYMRFDPVYARGAGWARKLAQTLWENEDYYLQIDSHTIFDPDWDEILINKLEHLKEYHSKPLITAYPDGFTVVDHDINKIEKHKSKHNNVLTLRVNKEMSFPKEDDSYVRLAGGIYPDAEYCHGFALAAGCYFTHGNSVQEILYDPYIFFRGEETGLALRYWTSGYSIFHTTNIPMLHHYLRPTPVAYRHTPWGDNKLERLRKTRHWEFDRKARKRLVQLTNAEDLGVYSLGKERTIEDYRKWCGVDFKNRIIEDKAVTGIGLFDLDYRDTVNKLLKGKNENN